MTDLLERLRAVQANAATMDSVKLASDCIEEIERLTRERDQATRLLVANAQTFARLLAEKP